MLKVFTDDGLPTRIVVQFWGEAATGGELRDEMMRTAARLRATIVRALLPWARTRASSDASDAEAEALASERTRAVVALAQGYVAHSAVFGPRDPHEYIDSIVAALT